MMMNRNFDYYKNLITNPTEEEEEGRRVQLWDLVVITAINEKQKLCYESQIKSKLEKCKLPKQFEYLVTNDPANCKIGSGGSTLNVIRQLYDSHGDGLYRMKILLIHAGGYSQRMPSCSILGKIFYPIATKNEYVNDMLDMKLAIYTPFAVHMTSGIFLTSSDDIETFDFQEQVEISRIFNADSTDFVLIAHKSTIQIAKDHGCYGLGALKSDASDPTSVYECECVLQKPSIELINEANLIQTDAKTNEKYVYTDSVFYFAHTVIHDLLFYSRLYYEQICDLNIEVDAYRDFLQPLGAQPVSLDAYLQSLKCEKVSMKRTIFENLYKIMSNKQSLVVALENSIFYHLGTINELFELYLSGEENEYSRNFRQSVNFTSVKNAFDEQNVAITNNSNPSCCLLNTVISPLNVFIQKHCILEYCHFNLHNSNIKLNIGTSCYLNNCSLNINELTSGEQDNLNIPPDTCLHTIAITNSENRVNYVTIFFSKHDNLKAIYSNFNSIKFLNRALLETTSAAAAATNKYDRLITETSSSSSSSKYSIWNLKLFKSEQTMSKSFISAINFINLYLNYDLNLYDKMLLLNEGDDYYYSLFDLLNYSNYENMIRFRNTTFL